MDVEIDSGEGMGWRRTPSRMNVVVGGGQIIQWHAVIPQLAGANLNKSRYSIVVDFF
jgi:hypothetical protein